MLNQTFNKTKHPTKESLLNYEFKILSKNCPTSFDSSIILAYAQLCADAHSFAGLNFYSHSDDNIRLLIVW